MHISKYKNQDAKCRLSVGLLRNGF